MGQGVVDKKRNGFYIFSFAEVQKLHSRFACHILPHEDVKYDVYMQELNGIMLYAVIFVPSQIASVLLTVLQCLSGILQETNG